MHKAAIFTVRDLNRRPAEVLAAVRKYGTAEIRARSGEVYTLTSKTPQGGRAPSAAVSAKFKAIWERQRELGLVPPPNSESDRINRIIAGEE